jgi:hypothetical protein
MSIKHSKVKNTGILFELLVRKIAADVLDGKSDSFAVKAVREHFHPKSELGKELHLYRAFFNTPTLSEGRAINMVEVVLQNRKKLNEKLLQTQKFNLIREIKDNCDLKQFLNGRVPSYKVYASIYKLFEVDTGDITELDDALKSRFLVVEHLKGELKEEEILKENSYLETLRGQDEEIRMLSYKFLLESFNKKYNDLSDKQKSLLREFINKGTNTEPFKKFVAEEAISLAKSITVTSKKIKDNVTKIKLHEVVSQLKEIHKKPSIKENHITAILIAYEIDDEISSLR